MGSLPCVDVDVFLQPLGVAEPLPAVRTHVRPLPGVLVHVDPQVGRRGVPLSTVVAHVRLLTRVVINVCVQTGLATEPLTAVGTGEGPVPCMKIHVHF